MALSFRETYNVALWNSNVELRTAKIKCRLESEKEEVEFRIVKLQCVTFRGSQDILPKLTLKRTKFNSIPRGSKGQAIAQTHKGFLCTANNFITSEIACLSSGVAEFWWLRCIVVRTKKAINKESLM